MRDVDLDSAERAGKNSPRPGLNTAAAGDEKCLTQRKVSYWNTFSGIMGINGCLTAPSARDEAESSTAPTPAGPMTAGCAQLLSEAVDQAETSSARSEERSACARASGLFCIGIDDLGADCSKAIRNRRAPRFGTGLIRRWPATRRDRPASRPWAPLPL